MKPTYLFLPLAICLRASATCNADNCLRALESSSVSAAAFCSTYTTKTAIATPSLVSKIFNAQCSGSTSQLLSACSCINPAATTSTSTYSSTSAKPTSSTTTGAFPTSTITLSCPSSSSSSFPPMITTSCPSTSPSPSISTIYITLPPSTNTITLTPTTCRPVTVISLLPTTTTTTITITATPAPTATLYCDTFYDLNPSCVNLEAIKVSDSLTPDCSGNFFESCVCPYLSTISGGESASGRSSDDWTYGFGALTDYCNCLGIAGEIVVISSD